MSVCEIIITSCGTKVRANSMHVRHAIVEVNVVIGVLLVGVRVVPFFFVWDAVVHLIVFSHLFFVAIVFT